MEKKHRKSFDNCTCHRWRSGNSLVDRYVADARDDDGRRDDGSNGRMRHFLFSAIRCAGYSGGGAGNCSA